jgi:hypothetical protein
MTDAEIDARAQELQQAADPKGLFRPPPWKILTERSRAYWRAKVEGEPPQLQHVP